MVGGKAIEVADVKERPGVIFVDVADRGGGRRTDTCAIYVERNSNSEKIEIGDSLWWQGGWAMWTPATYRQGSGKCGVDYDIKIPRVGFSGIKHPTRL